MWWLLPSRHEDDVSVVCRRRHACVIAVDRDLAKTRVAEHRQNFLRKVQARFEAVRLFLCNQTVMPQPRTHFQHDQLLQRVKLRDPAEQLDLVPASGAAAVPLVGPWRRISGTMAWQPVRPSFLAVVRKLVDDQKRTARLEMLVGAAQRLAVVIAAAPNT